MTSPDSSAHPDTDRAEALAFAAQFRSFLTWIHSEDAGNDFRNEASFLKELVRLAVLEALLDGGSGEVGFEHVDRALDDLLDTAQATTRALLGVGDDVEPRAPGSAAGSRSSTP